MLDILNQTNIKYKQSFYTLAIILLIILFIYYVHIDLNHCPKTRNVSQRKGRKKIKEETSTQYKVTDPISMAYLEHIHLRKGRSYPSKPPPLITKTWEEVRREKEERILKARRERALSTPLETTSTDAMDTEEAQEISKEIAEKAAERELRKQKYAQYQRTKQTADYKVPKTDPIPVPDLTKPKQKTEGRLP